LYDFWQFLHVSLATAWVGGRIIVLFLALKLGAQKVNPIAGPATGLMAKTAVPVFTVAALGTLVTGLIMAFGWTGFVPLWIRTG
jgi:putative copper export protein